MCVASTILWVIYIAIACPYTNIQRKKSKMTIHSLAHLEDHEDHNYPGKFPR